MLRSVTRRWLTAWFPVASVALGVMLVASVLLIRQESHRRLAQPSEGYSMVVGPAGDPLSLVLESVFHLGSRPGLMPLGTVEELRQHPSVRLAVPLAQGDRFRGYRVVATDSTWFDPRVPHAGATSAEEKLASGRAFEVLPERLQQVRSALLRGQPVPEGVREAVVGAEVASRLDIAVGDSIEPTHGGSAHLHEHLWTVVGVLTRSDGPADEAVLINLDSFYGIPDHGGAVLDDRSDVGVSSMLLFPRGGVHKGMLLPRLQRRSDLQVADVHAEVQKLLGVVGDVDGLMLAVAVLVGAMSLLGMWVSMWNALDARRRELAVLRAIGASRRFVFAVIVGEAALLTCVGALLGVALCHALLFVAAQPLTGALGFAPSPTNVAWWEAALWVGVTLAGAAAGVMPALRAYRVDVAAGLSSLS